MYMVEKKDINLMSAEQLTAYVESVRAKRRANSKKYYDEAIKNDPENFLINAIYIYKCYYKDDTNNIV